MKQTASIISTYTADVSGVCSALYELGGMTVMHDASGCNSTYNTHDEPRWYDFDSMVFLSGISEMEAIMGDDEKLLRDICDTANLLHPRFVAIAGTPIPMMIGTDLPAVAARVEEETGIPSFGLKTNSMHSYLQGVGMALEALAERFVDRSAKREKGSGKLNILGLTPLDFSVNGSVESMRAFLAENGFSVLSGWAMGSSLEELQRAGEADVNLLVSYAGMPLARWLQEKFGTPFVAGVPFGRDFSQSLTAALRQAAETGENVVPYLARSFAAGPCLDIIGESISAGSLAAAITAEKGIACRVICPLETESSLLAPQDAEAPDEDDITPLLRPENGVVADPLYRPICPQASSFYRWPSEAFSGRIFRREIPNLIGRPIDLEVMAEARR